MLHLTPELIDALNRLLLALVNQRQARVTVPAYAQQPGYWFGGGNILVDQDEVLWLSGRYRNAGDSRQGLAAGERGLECAIFRSDDRGRTFRKWAAWSKADMSRPGRRIISIEGTALHRRSDGRIELFVSSEKDLTYPADCEMFQKPGTGVWTIDRIVADSVEKLAPRSIGAVVENHDKPLYLHAKDPVVFDGPGDATHMLFCTHPYTWASANTSWATQAAGGQEFKLLRDEIVSRGAAWDVAATRITCRLPIPRKGIFSNLPPCSIYFYDGAECMREHDESDRAFRRPRGYSCEELGGAFFGWDSEFPSMVRLSDSGPLFVSPWGTGCSRYVDAITLDDGILATWQQSQMDLSQALVSHFLPMSEVESFLSGR
ncbi:MAG: exo-alpha-sialidase [Chloroflexi bacterium]|nr:exo-alpha-sialidase [Chloroflexota bacterium]